MNTFVVGDIHGGFKALEQTLNKLPFNIQEDKLIFLGDYIDGWSENFEVVEHIIELQQVMGDRLIALKGNHDIWIQEYLNDGTINPIWKPNGGQSTLKSYQSISQSNKKQHQKFFNELKDWYIDENNKLYIHAGFNFTIEGEFEKQATSIYYQPLQHMFCHWDRNLIGLLQSREEMRKHYPDYNYDKIENAISQFNEIYVGHTTQPNNQIFNYKNFYGIDTGCGWGNKLTIINADTKEIFQSHNSQELYPNEKGRK